MNRQKLYSSSDESPFRLSRTKIDLYLSCKRCFYLDRRLGVSRPSGLPFSLNVAVDALLKKEFDIHRTKKTRHPLMKTYGIDAVPFQHKKMEEWRDARSRGIIYHHKPSNFIVSGGIDDLWINESGDLHIVDYKATAKASEVTLDADWQVSYKHQMEVYQWLFRRNNFQVSKIGYFVYCNGKSDKEAFDGKLEFDVKIIPYTGDDNWVDATLLDIKRCLSNERIPNRSETCDYCRYVELINEFLEKSRNPAV